MDHYAGNEPQNNFYRHILLNNRHLDRLGGCLPIVQVCTNAVENMEMFYDLELHSYYSNHYHDHHPFYQHHNSRSSHDCGLRFRVISLNSDFYRKEHRTTTYIAYKDEG